MQWLLIVSAHLLVCVESTLIAICVVIAVFKCFQVKNGHQTARRRTRGSVFTEGLPSEASENRLEKPPLGHHNFRKRPLVPGIQVLFFTQTFNDPRVIAILDDVSIS